MCMWHRCGTRHHPLDEAERWIRIKNYEWICLKRETISNWFELCLSMVKVIPCVMNDCDAAAYFPMGLGIMSQHAIEKHKYHWMSESKHGQHPKVNHTFWVLSYTCRANVVKLWPHTKWWRPSDRPIERASNHHHKQSIDRLIESVATTINNATVTNVKVKVTQAVV